MNIRTKVPVVFEDTEGQHFFRQICGSKLRKYMSVVNTASFGAGDLKNLGILSRKLPELSDIILIPDGDMAKTWDKPPKNLLALPGDKRPETLIYRHLFSMRDSDPFWESTYTRQFAITAQGGKSLEKGDEKEWVKNWYKNQSKYWGRGNQKAFKSWVKAHKSECLKFCKKFVKLLKEKYKGEIPIHVIDRTLAEFRDSCFGQERSEEDIS